MTFGTQLHTDNKYVVNEESKNIITESKINILDVEKDKNPEVNLGTLHFTGTSEIQLNTFQLKYNILKSGSVFYFCANSQSQLS